MDRKSEDPVKTEFKVLVTGFGPFMQYDPNASYLIADGLPSSISPVYNPKSDLRKINIVVHRPAIRTSYRDVRTEVPTFLAEHPDADLVLHLGIAAPRWWYTIENGATRDGYDEFKDEDGNVASDLTELPGGPLLWENEYKAPKRLKTALQPLGELWRRTQSILAGKECTADVRPSLDAGNFCCGFIYYTALVERWRKGEDQNVLFLHTKGETDDDTLDEGRQVAMAVIRAAVDMICRKVLSDDHVSAGCGQCIVS